MIHARISFLHNSRELPAKQVSNLAKKGSLFSRNSVFPKLALACENQFRMIRISRKGTFSMQNKTEDSNKKKVPFILKLSSLKEEASSSFSSSCFISLFFLLFNPFYTHTLFSSNRCFLLSVCLFSFFLKSFIISFFY